MAEVLRHCHELGVVHRDLKPENFLLTSKEPDADLKVTDFGLSTFFRQGERFRELVGSPYYVAPEVLQKNYSHQADMWSLGVILYILLSGLPPFWGSTEEQIFKMVLKGDIDFKSEPWPKVSPEAKDCIRQMLTRDPSQRVSAHEILKHDWLVKEGVASDVKLDSVVLERMHRFAQASRLTHKRCQALLCNRPRAFNMNKLKKMALMVVGQSLSPDDVEGGSGAEGI
ncbi:hypothetical protein MNEG_11913 [Monoraphidium neglectum]|uniref:Protein kinase domain-containing protein n=1 Tax=Monoraphidium neglectum TaxID=145388 RepID=A0A0D2M421_9CHLO|nr:hypothetical protein MNEG_11913 [Monoraphidium neglectum]KIY96051.1 hypothetical protein MNEG_11913 [Monoraphidium neglectum]|eukprot:XP_013895071.1 hypothetical protein MNEG_11913 [Monoraphidium neglectum]